MEKNIKNGIGLFLVIVCLATPWSIAQESTAAPVFKPEELEQLVAPIALYPDSLLSQVFMASTYPLEVVQAERWAKEKKDLKGDALSAALEKESWDPSVKSLVNFPQVLTMMNEKLDWTQKLGDAFLAQQKDMMAAVQKLRAKAKAEGTLKTTEQQVVKEEPAPAAAAAPAAPPAPAPQTIVIESANPQVIYVPTYNPTVVYGTWPYPAYPPYYYYPPYYPPSNPYWFAGGVALGVAWGYAWGHCNWHGGDVDVNFNQNMNFNQNINRGAHIEHYNKQGQLGQNGQGKWQHNAENRKGVPYRDQATGQKFNRASTSDSIKSREDFRGRAEQGRQDIAGGAADKFKGQGAGVSTRDIASPIGSGNRPSTGDIGNRGGTGTATRPSTSDLSNRASTATRPSTSDLSNRAGTGSATRPSTSDLSNRASSATRPNTSNMSNRSSAFQDMDRGSSARASSSRGQTSRANISTTSSGAIRSGSTQRSTSRPSTGGSRSGGGGSRGGGGGRR